MKRTKEQEMANNMDCELYRLVCLAEREAKTSKHWGRVANALRDARPMIRIRMSAADRAETI